MFRFFFWLNLRIINIYVYAVSGLIICDQPTGAKLFKYWQPFSEEDWTVIFQQLATCHHNANVTLAVYCHYTQMDSTARAAAGAGLLALFLMLGARPTSTFRGRSCTPLRWN